MPRYCVTALEKFLVTTTYTVDAADRKEAERLCRDGEAAHEKASIEEGDEEWIKTTSIERLT